MCSGLDHDTRCNHCLSCRILAAIKDKKVIDWERSDLAQSTSILPDYFNETCTQEICGGLCTVLMEGVCVWDTYGFKLFWSLWPSPWESYLRHLPPSLRLEIHVFWALEPCHNDIPIWNTLFPFLSDTWSTLGDPPSAHYSYQGGLREIRNSVGVGFGIVLECLRQLVLGDFWDLHTLRWVFCAGQEEGDLNWGIFVWLPCHSQITILVVLDYLNTESQ